MNDDKESSGGLGIVIVMSMMMMMMMVMRMLSCLNEYPTMLLKADEGDNSGVDNHDGVEENG